MIKHEREKNRDLRSRNVSKFMLNTNFRTRIKKKIIFGEKTVSVEMLMAVE